LDVKWKQVIEPFQKQLPTIPTIIEDFKGFQIGKLDSTIITTKEEDSTLYDLFPENKKPKSYKLLFRASENQFRTAKFW